MNIFFQMIASKDYNINVFKKFDEQLFNMNYFNESKEKYVCMLFFNLIRLN